MKDENFYITFGWMQNQLHLTGNEEKIYAIIYGFTQDGKSEFRGGVEYLRDAVGISESNVKANINKLVKKGLLVKTVYKRGKTNGLRAVAPNIPKTIKRQKAAGAEKKASYDIDAFKKASLADDLVYKPRK